jgi:hypothetical protein
MQSGILLVMTHHLTHMMGMRSCASGLSLWCVAALLTASCAAALLQVTSFYALVREWNSRTAAGRAGT